MTEQLSENSTELTSEVITQRIAQYQKYLNLMEPFGLSATVLIALGDEVLLENGYGFMDYEEEIQMTSDAVLSIGSIAKQFTSTIVLRLQDQGRLAVEDQIGKYISGLDATKSQLTIHQLLTHTAGLPDASGDDFSPCSAEQLLDFIRTCELINEPGTEFQYSNVGFSLAAIIAEQVADMPYVEQLRELYTQLDINSASWFGDPRYGKQNSVSYYVEGQRRGSVYEWPGSHDPDKPYWHILGNGGITINHRDMFTYLRALFGKQLLSDKSMRQMLRPELNNYGYGWDIVTTPLGTMIRHDGGSSEGVASVARYYRDLDLTVLISSNTIINGFGMAFIIEELLEPILLGENIEFPPEGDHSQQVESRTHSLAGGRLSLEQLDYGPLLIHLDGQPLLNLLFEFDEEQQAIYSEMNKSVERFGQLMLEERWHEAFQLAERKDDYEQRAALLQRLQTMVEEQYGSVIRVESKGTVPFPEFMAMSLLSFVAERGSAGVPIIWNKPGEFLGFRPMISNHVVSCLGIVNHHRILAHAPQFGRNFVFRIDNGSINLT